MRVGRLILGSVVLGAVGTYAYNRTSDENKKKILGYIRKAVDYLPERVKGLIPSNVLDKLSGENLETGDVSRSAGPQPQTGGSSQGRVQGSR